LQAIERELSVARKRDDNDARARLLPRALLLPEAQPHHAEYLDELAYAYQQLGRFDDAVEAMRQAVAAGWDGDLDDHPSASALIADLLLRAGRTAEAEDAWLAAQREDPRNPLALSGGGIRLHGRRTAQPQRIYGPTVASVGRFTVPEVAGRVRRA